MFKKNTAARLGFVLKDSSGTPQTGKSPTVQFSLDGASFGASSNSAVEVGSGHYYIDATAAEMNADLVAMKVTEASSLQFDATFYTVAKLVSDLNDFDQATQTVDVGKVAGGAVAGVADFKADVSNLDVAVSTRSSHTAADVWAVASRTLTDYGTLVADIWTYSTRTLTSFGTLIADIWAYTTRALTDKLDFRLSSAGVTDITGGTDVATAESNILSGQSVISGQVAGLNDFDPTAETVDVGAVAGGAVAGVADFKADVSKLDVAVSTRSSHSAADAADAVLTEAVADHKAATGSVAYYFSLLRTLMTGGTKCVEVVENDEYDYYDEDGAKRVTQERVGSEMQTTIH